MSTERLGSDKGLSLFFIMTKSLAKFGWLIVLLLLAGFAHAQHTTVTAQVLDPTGQQYKNCTGSANFVGQNTTPGAPPYTLGGGSFQTVVPVFCDGSANFSVSLADNNVVTPGPSQWRFSLCSAVGAFPGPAICFNATITITGISQNITGPLQAAAATLPGGGGSYILPPLTISTLGGVKGTGSSLLCGVGQVINGFNSDGSFNCVAAGGGGGGGGTPGGSSTQIQYNAAGFFGGLPNVVAGSALVSQGISTTPVFQTKLTYDLRDYGAVCDGTTFDTAAASAIFTAAGGFNAKIQGPPGKTCAFGDLVWPANIAIDHTTGWKIKTPTDSTTTPGAATYNLTAGATGHCQSDNTSPTCAMSVTATANDTYIIGCGHGFTGGTLTFSSNVGTDVILPLATTSTQFSSQTQAAMVPNVTVGAHTFTATSAANIIGSCTAVPVSGLGPTPYTTDAVAVCSNSSANSPYTCTGTFTSGDFLLFVASQNNTAETCTGAGGGFTLISGAPGCSTTTLSNLALAYDNVAPGGSVTPTISFTPSPAGHNPASLIVGLRPASAIEQIFGPVINPGNNQIYVNATSGAGFIDYTGNAVGFDVWPEWWGAIGNNLTNSGQMTTNTAAINAAVIASFGTNRINGSGLQIYNKRLRFCGTYNVNGQITFNHINSFVVEGCGRLFTNLNQTATNTILWSGFQDAYGRFKDLTFSSSASQDIAHPLTLFDFNAALGADFAPQFIDFYSVGWNGNQVAAIGLIGAASGGGAQYSNINCFDCNVLNFTQAGHQVGTATALGQNALQIGYFGGDFQANFTNGFADYGGGYIQFFGTSMENGGYSLGTQTGADFFCVAPQGPIITYDVRSESYNFMWCDLAEIHDSRTIAQAAIPTPGTTQPVGTALSNDQITGDGARYNVTVDGGPFSGAGTTLAPLNASSGTSTTIVDTNQIVTGSVTIGSVGVTNSELMTQATSGATGTRLNRPSNNAAIAGTLNSGAISFGDSMSQATTGVTCTAGSGNTSTNFNCSNFSGAADNSHLWTDGTSGATFTPSATPVFAAASPVMLITAATGVPDSTHDWVGGVTGLHYTPTAAPTNQAAWTVNAFIGLPVGIVSGVNQNCKATITANTATSLTFSAGYSTIYPYTPCVANADTTTQFFVACPFSHVGTSTCGGMQYQYVPGDVVRGGSTSTSPMQGRIEDSYFAYGQINIGTGGNGSRTVIKNMTVTRPDWYGSNSVPGSFGDNDDDWDVRVFLQGGVIPANWNLPGIGSSGGTYTGGLHTNRGTNKSCWIQGTVGALSNTSASEICVGDSNDPSAASDSFRNRFGVFSGIVSGTARSAIGPMSPSPVSANQNGIDFDVDAGASTGSGTGGNINFRISNTGSSGTTPNGGTTAWQISGSTGNLAAQNGQSASAGSFNTTPAANFGQSATYTSAVCETAGAATSVNTGGTTTTTGLQCLPATAIIDAVVYRITTTITTAASFTVGDGTIAGRFCGTQSTLTSGTTGTCFVQADQTGTSGPRQVSAAPVVVTFNANPGAGAIRLFVFYHTFTPPTS